MSVSINWHDFEWCWKWKTYRYDFSQSLNGFWHLRSQNFIWQNEVHRFSDKTIKWFYSYLTNRAFFISLGIVFSEAATINCGAPQGSILGPLLFLLCIRILQALSNTHTYLYAYDASIVCQHKAVTEIENVLNKEFVNV